MNNTKTLFEKRKRLVPNGLGVFSPASAVTAKGAIVTDADGRQMIDFAGGIGVVNAGHCPDPVVTAIQEQASKLIHTCFNVAIYDAYLDLAEKLVDLFPHGKSGTKVMLNNSGAESVENAIKIARQATGRPAVLCYSGGFHGRTMMAMTLTSKVGYKSGCGPYVPEVYRLPYPYYGPELAQLFDEDTFVKQQIKELEHFFSAYVPADQIACVIVEVVQGEGGFNVLSKSYLQELREICTRHGILLVLDEVQTGFGRTGEWAGYQHYDVIPDLSTWAKSMGSGMPIGCVIGKAAIMDAAAPGTIGGTYPGNPICAAASLATINYMESIDINSLGRKVGDIIKKRFLHLQQLFPDIISDVRGLGAMMAIEMKREGNSLHTLVKEVIQRCNQKGLILISAGLHGNVIRVLCPLVISEHELVSGLDILEEALKESFTHMTSLEAV
ncbi:MAG: aspartate aminotransferase family protein [Cyclobacteriaceae bacterium]|nr:aspartate aminotransferase family protein [Cyclobacteriaceae bacterium HetDA_MAG_MS6]